MAQKNENMICIFSVKQGSADTPVRATFCFYSAVSSCLLARAAISLMMVAMSATKFIVDFVASTEDELFHNYLSCFPVF